MRLEQAIYGCQDTGGYRFLGQSAGFLEAWLAEAERLCTGYGERPAGVRCPLAVFARPLGKRHVAVVQVADQGQDDAGRPGALAFRILVLTRDFYRDLEGDLFRIAAKFQPDWQARGTLPSLAWEAGPPAQRTVADVRRILDVDSARTALLLGGAQVLVDQGRLVLRRNAPESELVRQLWDLLPVSIRLEAWPATFAFGNKHGFDLVVVPEAAADDFTNYIAEGVAGDYPEGRHESALHHAAEVGDQAELDALFAKPSRRSRFFLLLGLLGLFALVPLILNLPIGPAPKPSDEKPPAKNKESETEGVKPAEGLRLPKEAALGENDPQRRALRDRLNRLFRSLGEAQELGLSDADLVGMVARLDRCIDSRLGKKAPRYQADFVSVKEPVRAIRLLLYKHGVADYGEGRLNAAELGERLDAKVMEYGLIKEEGNE